MTLVNNKGKLGTDVRKLYRVHQRSQVNHYTEIWICKNEKWTNLVLLQ